MTTSRAGDDVCICGHTRSQHGYGGERECWDATCSCQLFATAPNPTTGRGRDGETESVIGLKPHECGTFTLTNAEKQELWQAAMRQKAERDARLPDEMACARALADALHRLQDLGWRDAHYARGELADVEMIEVGSTGIHRGYRDQYGFWINADGDTSPSRPLVYRILTTDRE